MKAASSSAFAHQVLLYSLVAIGFTGTAGLGAVWVRHQISVVANANKTLELRIAAVDRSCDQTAAEIAAEEDPAVLQRRNDAWHLGLVPPVPGVIRGIGGDYVSAFLAKANAGLIGDRPPQAITFRVGDQP